MNPLPGVEVILVSKERLTPYSGMLPARLADWYDDAQMHFDLLNLCAQSGVVFFDDEVVRLDPERQQVELRDRPPLHYDLISLNVGIAPALPKGAQGHPGVLAVKPIARLLKKWNAVWASAAKPQNILIVGGGAAGYELAVACRMVSDRLGLPCKIRILEAHSEILRSSGRLVRRLAVRRLRQLKIDLQVNARVSEVESGHIRLESGEPLPFDQVLFATAARAPEFLARSDLPVDDLGFVKVDAHLRVLGHSKIFAAGDCAHFTPQPLPKSGLYAVRQGPSLIENLRRTLLNKTKLVEYRPQPLGLALLNSGFKRALMWYGPLALEGEWVWRWKDHLDRSFMGRFQPTVAIQPMTTGMNTCGGCGGKIPASELNSLITELRRADRFGDWMERESDDLGVRDGLAASVDGFRTFTPDLHFFAQVAVWHALNDFYASGLQPQGVTLYAGLPESASALRQNRLLHLMNGAMSTLTTAKVPMLNGHSALSVEPTLVVTAIRQMSDSNRRWHKTSPQDGDVLLLTKCLGTGALLQSLMRGDLPAEAWASLKSHLLQNHMHLPAKLADFPVHACTDISGFGLVGHLLEMLGPQYQAHLDWTQLPILAGFHEVIRSGHTSELARQNKNDFESKVQLTAMNASTASALWDPQTHGPLLFAVPESRARELLVLLRQQGFTRAESIGRISKRLIATEPTIYCESVSRT